MHAYFDNKHFNDSCMYFCMGGVFPLKVHLEIGVHTFQRHQNTTFTFGKGLK